MREAAYELFDAVLPAGEEGPGDHCPWVSPGQGDEHAVSPREWNLWIRRWLHDPEVRRKSAAGRPVAARRGRVRADPRADAGRRAGGRRLPGGPQGRRSAGDHPAGRLRELPRRQPLGRRQPREDHRRRRDPAALRDPQRHGQRRRRLRPERDDRELQDPSPAGLDLPGPARRPRHHRPLGRRRHPQLRDLLRLGRLHPVRPGSAVHRPGADRGLHPLDRPAAGGRRRASRRGSGPARTPSTPRPRRPGRPAG